MNIPLRQSTLLLALSLPVTYTVCRAEYSLNELLEMDLQQLMEISIVTSSRHPVDLRNVPGVVRVVTAQQIRDRGYRHLGELLVDQPGIQVQRMTDGTAWNRVAINGVSGNNKFLILQDGVRINSPTGEAVPVDYNFSLYHVQRVEIVYGPASALYGADAMSGVINLITETPDKRSGEVAMEIGDFGSNYAHLIASEKFADDWGVSVGGHKQHRGGQNLKEIYDSVDPDTGYGIADSNTVKLPTESYSLNMRMDAGEHYKVMYNESRFTNSTHTSGETNSPIDFSHPEDYAVAADYIQQLRTLAVEGKWALNDAFTLALRVNRSEYEVDPRSKFVNAFNSVNADLTANPDNTGWKYAAGRRNQIEPQLVWQVAKHAVTLGATYEDYYALPKTVNLATPYDGSQSVTQLNYLNRGAYAEWYADWGSGLQSTIGVRHDSPTDYVESTNPRLNLVYAANENNIWRLGYGKAFLAPAPFLRYEQWGVFTYGPNTGLPQFVSNPDLEPERLQALDLGWQHVWENDVLLNLTLYHLKIDDVILAAKVDWNATSPGSYQNIGKLENRGVNVGLNWQQSSVLQYWLSASYLDGEVHNSDPLLPQNNFPAPYTASVSGSLGLTWRHNNYVVTPSVQLAGETDAGAFDVITESNRSPGYGLFNLLVRAENLPEKNGELTLKIQNLFDRKWYQPGSGGAAFNAVPQETRNIMLAYTWRY